MKTRSSGQGTDGGPPLLLVAGVMIGLFVVSLVAGAVLSQGATPSPYQPTADRLAYFARNADAVRATAVLQFAAAVPLLILAAAVYARLHHLGVRVAGADIALAGGSVASVMLMVSALLQWALARPGVTASGPLVLTMQDLSFLTGGAGHVVPLGLLVAGTAVPALLLRLLPRPLAVIGVVLAALAELSTLSLVWPALSVLLPLARFPILIWLLLAAWKLPRHRQRRPAQVIDGIAETGALGQAPPPAGHPAPSPATPGRRR